MMIREVKRKESIREDTGEDKFIFEIISFKDIISRLLFLLKYRFKKFFCVPFFLIDGFKFYVCLCVIIRCFQIV